MALASAPSLSFLPFALPLLVLAVPSLLRTCPFILPPCLLRVVGCLPHPFLTPCPLSPHLSVRLSHRLRHSRTSSSVSTISVLSLLAPLATSSPVTHSLIFLSFKGSWLIQTASPHAGLVTQILWVTIFTQAAQKAKLSVNEVLAGASSSRPPRASLHRCPGSDDARALGPAGTWVPFCLKPSPQGAHSQHHPTVRRTLPFAKGRLQPQQLFWQQTSFFSWKPCHHLGLERERFFPPVHKLSFSSFHLKLPLLFSWWLLWWDWMDLLVKLHLSFFFFFLSWSCLNSYKNI